MQCIVLLTQLLGKLFSIFNSIKKAIQTCAEICMLDVSRISSYYQNFYSNANMHWCQTRCCCCSTCYTTFLPHPPQNYVYKHAPHFGPAPKLFSMWGCKPRLAPMQMRIPHILDKLHGDKRIWCRQLAKNQWQHSTQTKKN